MYRESLRRKKRDRRRGKRGEILSHKVNFISEGFWTILKMKIAIIGKISREDPVEEGRERGKM